MPSKNGSNGDSRQSLDIVAEYNYTDERGSLLYQVCRLSPKSFRQRKPEGEGWTWRLGDVRRVLYRLQAVLDQVDRGGLVYVCEGEKDVQAVEEAGGVATCNAGGAGKWRDEYSAALKGAQVIIVADNDEPGRKHAAQVAASLKAAGVAHSVVHAAVGKDAADHLAAGKTLAELVADDAGPKDADAEARERWLTPMSAAEWAAFSPERPAYVLEPWAIPGYITDIVGREKGGKSTFVASACRAVAEGSPFLGYEVEQAPVLYLYEGGPDAWRYLMGDAGLLTTTNLHAHLWPMLEPTIRALDWPMLCEWTTELVQRVKARLLVLDILPTWARLAADAENDPGVARVTMEALRIIATTCNVAIWTLRHTRKGQDADHLEASRGTGAWIGSVDISLGYRKPTETQVKRDHPTRRYLSAIGRAVLPAETVVDFNADEHRFISVGPLGVVERRDIRTWLLENLPALVEDAIADGWGKTETIRRATDDGFTRNMADRTIVAMLREGSIKENTVARKGSAPTHFLYLGTGPDETPEGEFSL